MYKKIKVLAVSIIMGCILMGCQEVDKPEKAVTEQETQKAEIEKKVDFSEVYAPSEVCVYSASLWEAKDDYIVGVFLGDKEVEKILYALGPQYAYAPDTKKEEVVNIWDGGESFYGYNQHIMEAGVNYGYMKYYLDEQSPEYEKIKQEYSTRMKIVSKELDETDTAFINAKRAVTEYLKKLHMENYAVDEAAVFERMRQNKKGCLIYWTQVIDDIPVSEIGMDKSGNLSGTTVYNSKLKYNTKMRQRESMLETEFINDRLIGWHCHDVINVQKKLKQFPVFSVEEAYKKVEEQYQNYSSGVRTPILELVELQYKIIELDEKIYLYPIWTFCVSTEEKFKDTYRGEESILTYYNYFLIDAITGEYFTDIDTKEFEN